VIRNNHHGRYQSFLTKDEVQESLKDDWGRMTPAQQRLILSAIEEMDTTGRSELLKVTHELHYEREPVSVREFFENPYYMGKAVSVYPTLMGDLEELFAGDYHEAILGGAIGWGKCISPDTEVVCDGSRSTVGALTRRSEGFATLSMLEPSGTFSEQQATAFESGQKPCVRLTLAAGQQIELSTDHKVYTTQGWVEADQLKIKDLVACPRRVPGPSKPLEITDDEVALVAFLAADGGCTQHTTFTKADVTILKEVVRLAEIVGNPEDSSVGKTGVGWSRMAGKTRQMNLLGLRPFVRRWGMDTLSKLKRAPAQFYGLPCNQIALFLNRFLSCDGSVSVKQPRKVEVTLASNGLIEDLRFMLLRLGVLSRKVPKKKHYRGPDGRKHVFDAWTLSVTGSKNIVRFFDEVGFFLGDKEDACRALYDECLRTKSNPNTDVVPVSYDQLKEIRDELPAKQQPGFMKRWRCPRSQNLSREKFERLCEEESYSGKYAWLSSNDLVWEQVNSIESTGVQPVYDLSVPATKNFVGNGIVLHNTYLATLIVIRMVYECLCLRDPAQAYGLGPGSKIHFVNVSINEKVAKEVVFDSIGSKLKLSPFFIRMGYKDIQAGITFPKNVHILGGTASSSNIIGTNAFGGIMDEANFMVSEKNSATVEGEADKPTALYNNIIRRMKSRFLSAGRLPGKLVIVSSKRTKEDFTEKRVRQALSDPHVFYREYSTWDVNRSNYSAETFKVFVGNEVHRSRIMHVGEDVEAMPEGCRVIEIPEDYRSDFEADIESAIRDDAGFATVVVEPFITQREKLQAMVDPAFIHPFQLYDYESGTPYRGIWGALVNMSARKPLCCPHASRHAHIDASLNSCNTGFVVSHVCGAKIVERREGLQVFKKQVHMVRFDVTLRIVPPRDGEILQDNLVSLVMMLTKLGVPIRSVSMDRWQYVGLKQSLEREGYECEIRSCHNPGPYELFKQGIYEGRVLMYDYPPLLKELRELQKNHKTNRVDHPPNGFKDVADAACCAYTHWLEHPPFEYSPPPPVTSDEPVSASQGSSSGQAGASGSILWGDESPRQFGTTPDDDFEMPAFL